MEPVYWETWCVGGVIQNIYHHYFWGDLDMFSIRQRNWHKKMFAFFCTIKLFEPWPLLGSPSASMACSVSSSWPPLNFPLALPVSLCLRASTRHSLGSANWPYLCILFSVGLSLGSTGSLYLHLSSSFQFALGFTSQLLPQVFCPVFPWLHQLYLLSSLGSTALLCLHI